VLLTAGASSAMSSAFAIFGYGAQADDVSEGALTPRRKSLFSRNGGAEDSLAVDSTMMQELSEEMSKTKLQLAEAQSAAQQYKNQVSHITSLYNSCSPLETRSAALVNYALSKLPPYAPAPPHCRIN
jgi:hypothetical protein